ncbi:MAG: hypothetical protein EB060_05790 [Proteobacteria bacterium]|nr:hypothetical protein [Pseudomonadota bacterium]
MSAPSNYFDKLDAGDLTILAYLNLQDAYEDAARKGEPMPEVLQQVYMERLALRISILIERLAEHNIPVYFPRVQKALADVQPAILKHVFDHVVAARGTAIVDAEPAPPETEVPPTILLMSGGPASGKSTMIEKNEMAKKGLLLSRDVIFPALTPYIRLQTEAPELATHTVVTEAIYYNERDAYRYMVFAKIPLIVVDGTMSYTDLGLEMITFAQAEGYFVHVIHVDTDIDAAIARAEERAAATGKTINAKLLRESHVRTAANFFKYMEVADFTQSWSNDEKNGVMDKYAVSVKTTLEEVMDSTFMVAKRMYKYNQIVRDGGTIENDNQRLTLIHKDGDKVVVQMVKNVMRLNALRTKSETLLEDVEWPPNYETLLAERKLHTDVLEKFLKKE